MVDALHLAHRALRRGGVLIDMRPDSDRVPRLLTGGRVRGRLAGSPGSYDDDRAADASVSVTVSEGLFRPLRRGHLWHATTFASLAELDDYVSSNRRFNRYAPGARQALLPYRERPIVLRRSLKFALFQRA